MTAAESELDLLQTLESYHQVTLQVEDMVLAVDAQERFDRLEELIQQRAHLMAVMQQMTSEQSEGAKIRQKLLEIQPIDERVEQGFQVIRKVLQTKLQSLQQQKQSLNGYRPYSNVAAAFIDSKK